MKNNLMQSSILFCGLVGSVGGILIGAAFGAITTTLNGILVGAAAGLLFGILTGILTAALTVKTAGATGGVAIGAYTGMGLGAVIGAIIGALIPDSVRMSANTQNLPVLDALINGRFETAVLFAFFLCVLGTAVGAWVAGRNFVPRKVK